MSLTFSPTSHRYRLDGKPVKSVTGIMSAGIPKPALSYWAANQAAAAASDWATALKSRAPEDRDWEVSSIDPAALYDEWRKAPWAKRDEAAVRGTAVHDLAEHLVHGAEVDVPEHLAPFVEGYADFLDTWDVEPLLTEKSVASRSLWYAGRFDLIASIPDLHDGAPVMVDLKTSNNVYPDTAIQCAAYALADFYVTDDDPDTEHDLPEIVATYVAHVTAEGTRLYELSPDRDHIKLAYADFMAAYGIATRWNPKTLTEITK